MSVLPGGRTHEPGETSRAAGFPRCFCREDRPGAASVASAWDTGVHSAGFPAAGFPWRTTEREGSRMAMRRAIVATMMVLASVQCVWAVEGGFTISSTEALGISGGQVGCGDGTWFLGAGLPPSQLNIRHTANVNAADTTNADQLRSGGGMGLSLSGQGVTVGIWDGNAVRATHQEFGGRVTVVDAVGAADHATHVAGTIGAAGVNASAKGMAPSVSIRSREWTNDTVEMAADANLINISNHSYSNVSGWTANIDWGLGPVDTWYADRSLYSVEDPAFGKYTSATRDLDTVLYNNPKLLSVWAASNDRGEAYKNLSGNNSYVTYLSGGASGPGWYIVYTTSRPAPPSDGNGGTGYDCLPADQVAKNTLTVGSVLDHTVDPHNPATITTNSFSSYGPTDDGRIKPDVVGNGNSLTSSVATSDSSYASYSGTSMAAPNVTGSIALLVEHYRNTNSGATPNSATLKALVVHSATDAGNTGPDYAYGWGLMNAAAAAACITGAVVDPPSERLAWIFDGETYNGTAWILNLLSDGTNPFKATIAWTDPAPTTLPGSGLDNATSVLVNDLNLRIIGPDSTVYYPWTLDPANPSNPAVRTQANHVDNLEQVLINSPGAGWYSIRVAHTGTITGGTQVFSLIATGAVPEPTTLGLLVLGGLALLARRRRK